MRCKHSPLMIKPSVHPDLAAHAARFSRKVVRSGQRVYTYQGYNIASVSIIDAPDGLILVDCAAQENDARQIAADIAKQFNKPIRCVIYTHFHNDHVNGVEGFVAADDVDSGAVSIWSHDRLMEFITEVSAGLGPIMGRRASYTFGSALPRGDDGFVHAGLGLPHDPGPRGFIAPTNTISQRTSLSLCGVDLELIPIPSETDDMIGVWLADERILLSGDCIQGEVYPNLYTLRGTPYRDPMKWVETIDWIESELAPEIVVTHHGGPIAGRENVKDVFTAYRDAIQFTHDQTVRYINKGFDANAIVQLMRLPPHLAKHHWLGEFYGALKHCIPAIYAGKIGWFSGDPIELDPLPKKERAIRYIKLMGGQESVKNVVIDAMTQGDYLWGAELAGYLVSLDPQNADNRQLRANCLRAWAYQQHNPNWRNWALSCALELDPPVDDAAGVQQLVMAPPSVIKQFPVKNILKGMTTRLIAEKCQDTRITIAFHVRDIRDNVPKQNEDTVCALEIRKGVCQFHSDKPEAIDAVLSFEKSFFTDLILKKDRWNTAIESGRIVVDGDKSKVAEFFACFEAPPAPSSINFVDR